MLAACLTWTDKVELGLSHQITLINSVNVILESFGVNFYYVELPIFITADIELAI